MSDTQKVPIKALADLARVEISDAEMLQLEKEIPAILNFVEQIQSASTGAASASAELHNVMREDQSPHETGLYTKRLLAAAPAQKDDCIVVKQVVSRKPAQGKPESSGKI